MEPTLDRIFVKPGRYRHSSSRRSYYRVLLAVYWLADDEGLLCLASNAEIGRQAGLGAETVKGYMHHMEMTGVIATFRPARGAPQRTIVLMDHPAAERAKRSLLRSGRRPGLYTAGGAGSMASR